MPFRSRARRNNEPPGLAKTGRLLFPCPQQHLYAANGGKYTRIHEAVNGAFPYSAYRVAGISMEKGGSSLRGEGVTEFLAPST